MAGDLRLLHDPRADTKRGRVLRGFSAGSSRPTRRRYAHVTPPPPPTHAPGWVHGAEGSSPQGMVQGENIKAAIAVCANSAWRARNARGALRDGAPHAAKDQGHALSTGGNKRPAIANTWSRHYVANPCPSRPARTTPKPRPRWCHVRHRGAEYACPRADRAVLRTLVEAFLGGNTRARRGAYGLLLPRLGR